MGFVFEGRPNVFADATGVLRGGNTVVFRIGSDALGTARALMEHVVAPAIERVMTLVGKQVRKMVKRFDVRIAEELPPVRMNAGRIEQVA